MKRRNKELEVDFIGGMGPLTKEDEKAISDFIQTRKKKQAKKKGRRLASNKTSSAK